MILFVKNYCFEFIQILFYIKKKTFTHRERSRDLLPPLAEMFAKDVSFCVASPKGRHKIEMV